MFIAPGVQRLLAPNASMMTGPGTNTWLLGDPPVAVLDPGPDIPSHVEAILAAAPRLETIFVTHTHPDHSPAAATLKARCGARLVGRPAPRDGRQDEHFVPDVIPARDGIFAAGSLRLRAIDTPGHASNHVCWLLEGAGLLFSGDHILEGVTPVIPVPDGDLAAYLEALERLKRYPLRAIAPGHGSPNPPTADRRRRVRVDDPVASRRREERPGRRMRHGACSPAEPAAATYPQISDCPAADRRIRRIVRR